LQLIRHFLVATTCGPIFAIARFDKLRILVSVPEGYASNIRNGMPAQVFVHGFDDEALTH
jgi:hypothetical protein